MPGQNGTAKGVYLAEKTMPEPGPVKPKVTQSGTTKQTPNAKHLRPFVETPGPLVDAPGIQ